MCTFISFLQEQFFFCGFFQLFSLQRKQKIDRLYAPDCKTKHIEDLLNFVLRSQLVKKLGFPKLVLVIK